MSNRSQIPSGIADNLMVMNRRICCICNQEGKHLHIHHIDGNHNNNDIENLAVLCLECHSRVTGDEGFGRRFTPNEVSIFKKKWEEACDSWYKNKSGVEEAQGDYEETILAPDTHIEYSYKLSENDKIAIWATANKPISIFIIDSQDYNDWLHSGDKEDFKFLEGAELENDFDIEFDVPEDGFYTVLLLNESNESSDIEFDIQIWEPTKK
jgi:hypothetical protein